MPDKNYNLQQLEELAAGSEEFVQSMIEVFLEHTPAQLESMLQAHRSGDLVVVGNIAHKIKPNIDLFNINDLHRDIRVVEEKGKAGINDDELNSSLLKVEQVLRESFKQMGAG